MHSCLHTTYYQHRNCNSSMPFQAVTLWCFTKPSTMHCMKLLCQHSCLACQACHHSVLISPHCSCLTAANKPTTLPPTKTPSVSHRLQQTSGSLVKSSPSYPGAPQTQTSRSPRRPLNQVARQLVLVQSAEPLSTWHINAVRCTPM